MGEVIPFTGEQHIENKDREMPSEDALLDFQFKVNQLVDGVAYFEEEDFWQRAAEARAVINGWIGD